MFGSVKLTKNTDIDKYGYSGYGIGFDRETYFSFGNDIGKNVIIFGVDMSSSSNIETEKRTFYNIDPIKRVKNLFDWEKAFFNIDVGKMVSIFNQDIINILYSLYLSLYSL